MFGLFKKKDNGNAGSQGEKTRSVPRPGPWGEASILMDQGRVAEALEHFARTAIQTRDLSHMDMAERWLGNQALLDKAGEFDGIIKMGRTQLQDAVPIRLGQEFHAYAAAVARDIVRFDRAKEELRSLNLGGTAIGTGLNANADYVRRVVGKLSELTGEELTQAPDLIDGTQNLDCYPAVSGILKSCAVTLSKMCNDLRLMSSGPRTGLGEIDLPAKQNGSSIMPGKVNPVIPEVVNQVEIGRASCRERV